MSKSFPSEYLPINSSLPVVRASSACVTPQHFLSAHGTNSVVSQGQRKPSGKEEQVTAVAKPLAGLGTVREKRCSNTDSRHWQSYSSVSSKAAVLGRQEVNKSLSLSSGRRDEEKRQYLEMNSGKLTGLATKEIIVMKDEESTRLREWTYGFAREVWGRRVSLEWTCRHVHSAIFKMDNKQGHV